MCPITRSDTPARRQPARTASRSSGTVGRAVVDDLVAGGAGDPVDQVVPGVVAAGVLGGGVASPGTARSRPGRRRRGSRPRGTATSTCAGRQPVRVVAGREGEPGHRLVAALPLGGAAADGNGKKIRSTAAPGCRRRRADSSRTPETDSVTVYGRSRAVGAVQRVQLACAAACPRSARSASRRAARRQPGQERGQLAAGRASIGGSPAQYSCRRSSSVQSPASAAATGPGWNQLRVSVGGE